MDFCDDLRNLILITNSKVYWRNYKPDDTFFTVLATTTEIPISNLENVGLSGNKAIFAYSNKLVYYEITGMDALTKIFERTIASSDLDFTQSGGYQYKISLTCLCKSIKRFACFSSTLNCIIVKKGQNNCQSEIDLTP